MPMSPCMKAALKISSRYNKHTPDNVIHRIQIASDFPRRTHHSHTHDISEGERGASLGCLTESGVRTVEGRLVAGIDDIAERQERHTQSHTGSIHSGNNRLGERYEGTDEVPGKQQ